MRRQAKGSIRATTSGAVLLTLLTTLAVGGCGSGGDKECETGEVGTVAHPGRSSGGSGGGRGGGRTRPGGIATTGGSSSSGGSGGDDCPRPSPTPTPSAPAFRP
ncbi:hypothetical protein ACFVUW_09700 [Streptomyces xiamenensis]|uniref:hypothetical protein n=1 Tax=Streptomyces xiamenensis TaxID=408015 RepID=UPI0036EF7596